MNENKVIQNLLNVIESLTEVIKEIKLGNSKVTKPTEVSFDEISNPFGMKGDGVPEPIIKEVEKIVEIIKEVPVEVIKEVEKIVEVIKEVEKIVEIIKEVKPPENKIVGSSIRKEEPKEIKQYNPNDSISKEKHDFPEILYHESGFKMSKYKGELKYVPEYELTPNQEIFGLEGQWNVVVTYDKDKNRYVTEHPEPQFNTQILYSEKLEK